MSFTPEIRKGDELYGVIRDTIYQHEPDSIVEVGSANGLGSTQAIIEAIHNYSISAYCPSIDLVEINNDRYLELIKNVSDELNWDTVNIRCGTLCGVDSVMSEPRVVEFLEEHNGFVIATYPEKDVLSWRKNDVQEIENAKVVPISGEYDLVILDGSAFTGYADLEAVYGSNVIIMDDTIDIKNFNGYCKLKDDASYELVTESKHYRNGYAVFERVL